jgi:Uncharacterised nucleotidyltransferase
MKNKLTHSLSHRLWPDEQRGLLLGAALLDDAKATSCWNNWTRHLDIETATWEDHKIFARLAGRLRDIAPESPYRPRLEGLAKAHWTQSQLMLRSSAVALDLLTEAGIPVILLKGAALQALPFKKEGLRITSDLDIMVRRADFPRAIALLHEAGWRSKDSLEYSIARWRFDPGTNLRYKSHGDIDIHHQPVHGTIIKEDVLEAFWQRAVQGNFLGREVLIPSLADLLVIAAEHAAHSFINKDCSAIWVFDVSLLAKQADINPDQVAKSAQAFKAVPSTLGAFLYLRHLTEDPSLDNFIGRLETLPLNILSWLRFFLTTMPPRIKFRRSLRRRVFRLLGQKTYRDVVPHINPSDAVEHSANRITVDTSARESSLRQEIPLPPKISIKSLVLELAFHAETERRYQFDIAADGEALARLSVRVHKGGGEVIRRCSINLQPLKMPRFLAVESLSAINLPVNASANLIRSSAPVPFRLLGLSWK